MAHTIPDCNKILFFTKEGISWKCLEKIECVYCKQNIPELSLDLHQSLNVKDYKQRSWPKSGYERKFFTLLNSSV